MNAFSILFVYLVSKPIKSFITKIQITLLLCIVDATSKSPFTIAAAFCVHARFKCKLCYDDPTLVQPLDSSLTWFDWICFHFCRQLEEILQSKSEPLPGEELLASLTAWERTKWAEVRRKLFSRGINRVSLNTIETSAFVLALDDDDYETNIHQGDHLDDFGKALLHGNGHNRWFDKSFTVCVGTNGRVGFNAEHTW